MLQVNSFLIETLFPDVSKWYRILICVFVFLLFYIPTLFFMHPYTYYYGWISLPIPLNLILVGIFAGISSKVYLYFLIITVSILVGLTTGASPFTTDKNRPKFVNMPKQSFVTYFIILINCAMYLNTISTLTDSVPKENFESSVFCVNSAGNCKQDGNYQKVLDRAFLIFTFETLIVLYNVWRSACATEIVIVTHGETPRKFVRNGWKWVEQQQLPAVSS